MRLRYFGGEKGWRRLAAASLMFTIPLVDLLFPWLMDRSLADVRKELAEGLSSMSLRVKFDLLHDESPQV